MAIYRYTASGEEVWSGASGSSSESCTAVAVSGDYVSFTGRTSADMYRVVEERHGALMIARSIETGEVVEGWQFGSSDSDFGSDLVADGQGGIHITGARSMFHSQGISDLGPLRGPVQCRLRAVVAGGCRPEPAPTSCTSTVLAWSSSIAVIQWGKRRWTPVPGHYPTQKNCGHDSRSCRAAMIYKIIAAVRLEGAGPVEHSQAFAPHALRGEPAARTSRAEGSSRSLSLKGK